MQMFLILAPRWNFCDKFFLEQYNRFLKFLKQFFKNFERDISVLTLQPVKAVFTG